MSFILSVANRKGGVGKTTLSLGLAEAFLEKNFNTLVIDLDPQSSITEALLPRDRLIDAFERQRNLGTILKAMTEGQEWDALSHYMARGLRRVECKRAETELALIPNSPSLWDIEYGFINTPQQDAYKQAVPRLLNALKDEFDIIIIDCPPGKTLSAEQAILASDLVLCPIVPELMSLWGMQRMTDYLHTLGEDGHKTEWRYILSRNVDRYKENQRVIEKIGADFADHFLTSKNGGITGRKSEYIRLDVSQDLVKRIALLSEAHETTATLDKLYKKSVKQLRNIREKIMEFGDINDKPR